MDACMPDLLPMNMSSMFDPTAGIFDSYDSSASKHNEKSSGGGMDVTNMASQAADFVASNPEMLLAL